MLQNNPYNVLSETISFENVQQMGELITLKCLRGYCAYSRQNFEKLYTGYVRDLNRRNNPAHTFSDAYDIAQTAICFLCEFIGKELTDIYQIVSAFHFYIRKMAAILCVDNRRFFMIAHWG